MRSWLRKEQFLAAVASGLVGCGGGESMGPSGPDGEGNPAVKRIMVKLAKGPDSLTARIGKELNETPPPWDTIQAQSKDYVLESGELAKQEPKKGSKESWAKLTAALIESADLRLTIPGTGTIESLNVAATVAVVLGEYWRQRHARGA